MTNVPPAFSPFAPLVALNEKVPAGHPRVQEGARTPDPNAESPFGALLNAAGTATSAMLKTASTTCQLSHCFPLDLSC
jgi:hypothetical protein